MNNNLSLLKIITGLSKTLNIANQMIPLYKQAKPLITKSSEIISNLKVTPNKSKTNNIVNSNPKNKEIIINEEAKNLPTFFQ